MPPDPISGGAAFRETFRILDVELCLSSDETGLADEFARVFGGRGAAPPSRAKARLDARVVSESARPGHGVLEVVGDGLADPAGFLAAAATLAAPGGLLVVATLNRTAKAFALAIVGAEYILGWLPRGSHDWRRFLKPSELAALLRPHGLALCEALGVVYSPIADKWRLAPEDLDVNYMLRFEKT